MTSDLRLAFIQSHLLDVFRDFRIHEPAQRTFGGDRFADRSRRDRLMHTLQQVNRRACQHQISLGGLLGEGLAHGGFWPKTFRQCVGYVGKRVAWTAGHDECTFAQQCFRLTPLGDFREGVNSDEEEDAINFLQRLLEPANRIDAEIRAWRGDWLSCSRCTPRSP